jgi:hypothetical protein
VNRHLLCVLGGVALVAALGQNAHADLFELRWAAEGYYRSRAVFLTNLAAQDRRVGTEPVRGARRLSHHRRAASPAARWSARSE